MKKLDNSLDRPKNIQLNGIMKIYTNDILQENLNFLCTVVSI